MVIGGLYGGVVGRAIAAVMDLAECFLLFDDARPGGEPARLYRRPAAQVVAWHVDEVGPALEELRARTGAGQHAAGFLAYEAGFALDPALAGIRVSTTSPLL